MKCLVEPYKNKKIHFLDDTLDDILNFFKDETSLEVKKIYFKISEKDREQFSIYLDTDGFIKPGNEEVCVIDEIPFAEAKRSWIKFFKG